MSEQAESPVEEAVEPTPEDAGGIDWRKRYEDLRPQYDRVQNEASQYQDPEYRKQLFQELAEENGYTLGGPDEVYEDPTEQLRAELRAELQQELSKRDQAAAQADAIAYAEAHAESKLDELKVQSEKARDWIALKATAMPALRDENGFVVPDIEAAYEEYTGFINDVKKSWGNTKTGAVAASEGQANTGVPAWKNEQDPDKRKLMRDAWAMEQIQLRMQGD